MALTDYSSMEGEIKNAPEPTVLKKGTEVKARIIKVNSGVVANGGDYDGCSYYSVVFDAPDEPLAKEFSDFFWELDKEKLSEKDFARAINHFKKFAEAFEIDYSRPFDWEDDLPGSEGWLIVGIKKSDEYGEQNTVQKYLAPTTGNKSNGPAPGAPF
jgi:hypothetical protein